MKRRSSEAEAALVAARGRLCRWQTPEAMQAEFRELIRQWPDDLLSERGAQWVREAFLAAMLGRLRSAVQVRLVAPPLERPDFELRFPDGSTRSFEATVALHKDTQDPSLDQKPNKERRITEVRRFRHLDWSDEQVVEKLQSVVASKSQKPHQDCSLLIYWEVETYFAFEDVGAWRKLASLFVAPRHPFRSIWVLAGSSAARIDGGPFEFHTLSEQEA